MAETGRPFTAGIVDFNPKRMSPTEAHAHGIPDDLIGHLGDWRQYPPNIAQHFPEGVSWFRAEQPWYFGSIMTDEKHLQGLRASDVLILSGSGLSAHRYQHGEISEEYRSALEKSQEVIRDHLGEGKWILGICFGGQLAIHAVGGDIGRLPDNVTEAGWLPHQLTSEGRRDDMFSVLPNTFFAPHLHNDYVEKLPPVGTKIRTSSGETEVVFTEVLAMRAGYQDKTGLVGAETNYIMASVVAFSNGARLYQIQPHPEMATPKKANYLVRMNPWIGKENEMGEAYYQKALLVPEDADFSVAKIIPRFVHEAQRHLEEQRGIVFMKATLLRNLFQYLIP